jgi:hypothetical protein
MSKAPPPGYYVPAVLFMQEDEEFDIPAIKAHILRLAQVWLPFINPSPLTARGK